MAMISGDRCAKVMIASSRLRNSGADRYSATPEIT
jgi:hypothetical protein